MWIIIYITDIELIPEVSSLYLKGSTDEVPPLYKLPLNQTLELQSEISSAG